MRVVYDAWVVKTGPSVLQVRAADALYGLTVLVSAFLLFQIQPIIAKIMLPWYGGSAAVWTTCMLFFQVALLAGYLYAHWLVTRIPARRQGLIHGILVAISLFFIRITPTDGWRPSGTENPTLKILAVLTVVVGLPYFLLSTTGPLLQAWFARSRPGAIPYRLYALSNFGSLLALVSYPALIEPVMTTRRQMFVWACGYGVFALICVTVSRLGMAAEDGVERAREEDPPPALRRGTRVLWFVLPACASTLFLSVTNFVTQDVAAVPLLWILPLGLYLLSFIVAFDSPRWYHRTTYMGCLMLLLVGAGVMLYRKAATLSLHWTLAIFALVVFIGCMICHGELAKLKPHAGRLTGYYLMISLGGAAGGLAVGVGAPYFLDGNLEVYLALAACALTASAVQQWDSDSLFHYKTDSGRVPLLLVITALITGVFAFEARLSLSSHRIQRRNFYGSVAVDDDARAGTRTLVHGTIIHGVQFLDAGRRKQPTTYYCADSGVGWLLEQGGDQNSRKIGIVGLGTGTLAAYGRRGDVMRFYEINPLVVELARTEFSFLRDSEAKVEIVSGDARIALEEESRQNYDVLVIDAFSGDSIPAHLLTLEAFRLYVEHLSGNGVLALHLSNRYLDLPALAGRAAEMLGMRGMVVVSAGGKEQRCNAAEWVLMGMGHSFGEGDGLPARAKPLEGRAGLRAWTDDFSNLFSVMK